MRIPLIAVAAIALALAGCGTVTRVTPAMVGYAKTTYPDMDEARLKAARDLCQERCTRCHFAPTPAKHSPDDWNRITRKMQPKAKLSDAQREEILRFLLVARAAPNA